MDYPDCLAALIRNLGWVDVPERVAQMLAWLIKQPTPAAKFLTGRISRHTPIRDDEIRELELNILRQFQTKQAAYTILRGFVEWVDAGNHHKLWDICPPRIPIWHPSPQSPFDVAARGKPVAVRLIRAALEQQLVKDRQSWTPQVELGLLFLSALLNGGLHHGSLLAAVADRVHRPLHQSGAWAWIDLPLAWRQQEDAELRRWFPDPVSELLLLGLSPAALTLAAEYAQRGWRAQKLWSCIYPTIKQMVADPDQRPDNLSELLDWARYQQLLSGPAFLGEYNRKGFVSHALKPQVWARLLGVRPPLPEADAVAPVDHGQIERIEHENIDQDLIESPWYGELMRALKQDSRTQSTAALHALAQRPDWRGTIRGHLVFWSLSMREKGAKSGHKLALSTVVHYLATAGKRLAALIGDEPILTLTAEGYAALYQAVLDDAVSPGHRRNLGRALREFHHYLVSTHDVAGIHDAEILGAGIGLSTVDANILTLEEYNACLNELRRFPPLLSIHADLAEAAALITMIAFRCGTRRMEVLRLRRADLHITKQSMELLIRPWDNRRLKTKSATRKIPLQVFLSEDEQAALRRWHTLRRQQEESQSFSLQLFAVPEAGMDGISQEFLYPKLHHVMRQVTGDTGIRFHHLRHSFATWTLLRLFLADLPQIPEIFPALPETQCWLNESPSFRRNLYGHTQITRKHLHAVASLMGHASPDMTLEHYIHALDLIEKLNREASVSPGELLHLARTIAPVPERTIYNHRAQKSLQAILRLARLYRPDRVQGLPDNLGKSAASGTALSEAPEPLAMEGFLQFQNLWALLTLRSKQPTYPLNDLYERFGFSATVAKACLNRADYLRNLIAKKTFTPRHRVQARALDGETTHTRGLAPQWPRNKADEQQLIRLAQPMWQLILQPDRVLSADISINDVLRYFVDYTWFSRHELMFKSLELAPRVDAYLELLRRLGLNRDEIRIHVFGSPSSALEADWKRAVPALAHWAFIPSAPFNKKSQGLAQAIGIKVINPELYDGQGGSQGFRVLMHLAAVRIASLTEMKH